MVNHILSKSEYSNYKEAIFNKLKDESDDSVKFIDGFINITNNLSVFIKTLCSVWFNIWEFIDLHSNFLVERKTTYLKYILEHASISDLVSISENSNLTKVITNDPEFLSIIPNKEKIKSIIAKLYVRFPAINFGNSPNDLLDFIYENDNYQLNPEMQKEIIKFNGNFNQVAYDNSNFGCVKKSNCDLLIQRIESHIDDYLENIYLLTSA